MAVYRAVCNVVDNTIASVLTRWGGFCPNIALTTTHLPSQVSQKNDSRLRDSILWTTPRGRRTVEKRWTRRFGCQLWGVHFGPQLNKKIRVDHKTGEYYEIGKLAPQTYKKVMEETRRIQKRMKDSFGVGVPKDEETLVIYQGENKDGAVKGRVVEMEYERPSFFSKNLLQKEYGKPGGSQETRKSALIMADSRNEEDDGTPVRSLRKRKSIDYSDQNNTARSRRNSASRASAAPDLEFITENDREEMSEGDENDEDAFLPSSALNEAADACGKELFGFQTPKKSGAMALKVAEEMRRTPLSEKNVPHSSSKATPSKSSKKVTPLKSNPTTPVRGILKTPTSGKRGGHRLEPETPLSSKKRVKKTLIKISENDITHNYSDHSESEEDTQEDESDEDDKPIMKGPPATPRTPARKGRRQKQSRDMNQHNMAESYFAAQSQPVLTSDRTLAKLKTPRLSDMEVNKLLKSSKQKYDHEIRELMRDHFVQFPRWMSLLHRGYSIVCYGLGSKKSLLHNFHEEYLLEQDAVVVNGFFPSLTMKQILSTISEDILEIQGTFTSTSEHIDEILSSITTDLYLIIHNIDGPMLRNSKVQTAISNLVNHPKIHLICSIDHINAPLIWDQACLSKLNLIWFDTTTFLPYLAEAGDANTLMVRKTGQSALASLSSVWASLTPNAKKIYIIIIKYQLESGDEAADNYQGLAFMELYRKCRSEFLVASDLALRAQLTEFRDHKLIRSKKGADGGEYLTIPLDKPTLSAFLENIQDK